MGEGGRDTAFLQALCAARSIHNLEFHEVGGNSNFGKYLEAISAQSAFKNCRSILLVGDNDASASKSFQVIKDQLNAIKFPSPPRALEIAHKQDLPSIGVLMLPYPDIGGSAEGCLETLLIPAMESAHAKEAGCVDQLMKCADVISWPKKGSRDKLKVRCLISTVWKDDPMYGLPFCFSPEKGLVPLGHSIFDGVAEILREFPSWSTSTHKTWTDWKAAIK